MIQDNAAATNFWSAVESFGSHPLAFLVEAFREGDWEKTPYTALLLVVISALFIAEVILQYQFGTGSTESIVAYLFIYSPSLSWPLAPFLHRGIIHYVANTVPLYIAAPLESRLGEGEYIGLFIGSGYLPVYLDGLKLELFGREPHVAAYGTSAFVFGLLGFGLISLLADTEHPTPRGWLIVALGLSGIVVVVIDLWEAIHNPLSLNLGHLCGLVVGTCWAYHKQYL